MFVCIWPCLYVGCMCLRLCLHICECVCLCGGCVVFVCVSGHVCMVTVGVCMCACMLVNARACKVIVVCLCASLAMFVL